MRIRNYLDRLGQYLRRSRPARRSRPRQLEMEALENRVVPAVVDLVWVNQNAASNNFALTFGANEAAARRVVEDALTSWERALSDSLAGGTDRRIDLFISMDRSTLGFGGGATITDTAAGFPTVASITLDSGNDTNADGFGDGTGWVLDPTPLDSSEFQGDIVNAFAADAQPGSPADGMPDFYTLIVLELTHAVGMSSNSQVLFQMGGVNSDVTLTDTGVADNSEGGGVGNFWVFQGPTITHLMTREYGGPAGIDRRTGAHTAGPGDPVNFNNQMLFGAEDCGNALYESGRRYLPANTVAMMLHDVYDYTITQPERFGTFYAMLNETTRELLVRGGAGVSDDDIHVAVDGNELVVSVDVGADVPGTGPTDAFESRFDLTAVASILIQAGGGADTIRIDSVGAGMPVTVEAGAGEDTIDVGPAGGTLDDIDSTLTIDGGDDSDKVTVHEEGYPTGETYRITSTTVSLPNSLGTVIENYAAVEDLQLLTGGGPDYVEVESVALGVTVTARTGLGDDTFDIGTGNLDFLEGAVSVDGEGDTDTVTLHDDAVPFSDDYGITATTVNRNFFGGLTYEGVESLTLNAQGGDNGFTVHSTAEGVETILNGGDGDDTFDVGAGDLNALLGALTVEGEDDTDTVTLHDDGTAAGDAYTIHFGKVTRTGGTFAGLTAGTAESLVLNAQTGSNTVYVYGIAESTPVTVHAGGGADTLVLQDEEYVGETYTATGPTSGTIALEELGFSGNSIRSLTYAGVETINDLNAGPSFPAFQLDNPLVFNATSQADGVHLQNGPVVGGVQTVQLRSSNGSFVTLNFANKGRVTINELDGRNTTVVQTTVRAGMTNLVINGGAEYDRMTLRSWPAGLTVTVRGGGDNDALQGPHQDNSWIVTGTDQGTLNGSVTFSAIPTLVGGHQNDGFTFQPGSALTGILSGGTGTNTMDYSAWSDPVSVNLTTGFAMNVANQRLNRVAGIHNVIGGSGDDLLVGNGDANALTGNAGRDLLIGGLGMDALQGGPGDDLLIDGTTSHDANRAALDAIFAEWTRTDLTGTAEEQYRARINHLRNGGGRNAVNGSPVLLDASTVSLDAAVADVLTGGDDWDWFWSSANDSRDAAAAEQVN